MPQYEIERKFFLTRKPVELLTGVQGEEIRQGYLLLEADRELRIRQRAGQCSMTLKSGQGLKRQEQECAIPRSQFEMLWPLTAGRRIEKVRYAVRWQGYDLEIDLFSGTLAPLMVLEVEFATVAAAMDFVPPEFAGRDLTADKAYKNAALASHGLPLEMESADE